MAADYLSIQRKESLKFNTGGVAKNRGMFSALEEALGTKITSLDTDPQIIGALGAALIAC
jgi:activator of 2-hydroxyglutaryl-CoA dehydratase